MSNYRVPISKRVWWFVTDAAEIIGYVLLAVVIALLCAVVIGLAVRLAFWAAGIG